MYQLGNVLVMLVWFLCSRMPIGVEQQLNTQNHKRTTAMCVCAPDCVGGYAWRVS
jgi:hypothetical protein